MAAFGGLLHKVHFYMEALSLKDCIIYPKFSTSPPDRNGLFEIGALRTARSAYISAQSAHDLC